MRQPNRIILLAAVSVLPFIAAKPAKLEVRHTLLADLGHEHIAHAVFRHTPEGGAVIGWGERILQWPLGRPELTELQARRPDAEYSNGGCAIDVNGDGRDEIVVARGRSRSGSDPELLWFEEAAPGKPWTEHYIAKLGTGQIAPHDIEPLVISRSDGVGVRGVVAVLDRRQLIWFEIPNDPRQPWPRHEIAELPLASQSGIAVGDVAEHGRPDVVCGMFWAECPADPTREAWRVHRFGQWQDGGWGGMAKLALADMDGDGHLDIVASEAEIPDARLGVFTRNAGQLDAPWHCREVEKGLYCPHSLVLADLDGDKRTDIVVGEMTAGGWSFPLNARPRIMAYLNRGNDPFERRQLVEGEGVHEMGLAPKSGDGALTIFAADEIQPQKFPEMKTRVSAWTITLMP